MCRAARACQGSSDKPSRDKIEFQFAVPNVRRTHSALEESRFQRDREINPTFAGVNRPAADFFKNLCQCSDFSHFNLQAPFEKNAQMSTQVLVFSELNPEAPIPTAARMTKIGH